MMFVIRKFERPNPEPQSYDEETVSGFVWTLHKVVKGEVQEPVVRSVKSYPTEKDARADIASAKIALRGARFAKVTVET